MADFATEFAALISQSQTVNWPDIAKATRVLIAKAAVNGGVVSYSINGRSVTHSIAELREILKLAESEIVRESGGIFTQLGEFTT